MEKYNWVAQDSDGEVHEYINKPSTKDTTGSWWGKSVIGNSRRASEPTTKAVPNWKETIIDLSKNDYIIKDGILMATRKHALLIHAWADGAEIQLKLTDDKWDDCNPSWDETVDYRIKPATRTVKFKTYHLDGAIGIWLQDQQVPPPGNAKLIDKEWREVEIEL